jgi:alpha-1,6-mannosyltransferase
VRDAAPSREERPLRIAWIGRLVREKNAHLLPHLARALRDRGVKFELVILGHGPLADDLHRELDASGDATLTGWLPPERVAEELRASDVYLSLSDTESYSLTASEALASGVPVVAPNVIGFRRLGALDVGALFSAQHLSPRGMSEVARVVAESLPRLDEWARKAATLAPDLSWTAALDALYGDLEERTGCRFRS